MNKVRSSYSEYMDALYSLKVVMDQAINGTMYPPWELIDIFLLDDRHMSLDKTYYWLPFVISWTTDHIPTGTDEYDFTDVNWNNWDNTVDLNYKSYLDTLRKSILVKPLYDLAVGYESLHQWINDKIVSANTNENPNLAIVSMIFTQS